MKKILSLILVVVMISTLSACNNNSNDDQQEETNANSATTIEKTEAKEVNLGDTISLEFMEMTIDDFIICDLLQNVRRPCSAEELRCTELR